MAFQSREELNGELDPKINTKGRSKSETKTTRRSVKDKEFLGILRKLKPHLSDSIITASKIMRSDSAKDADRLKACIILMNAYKEFTEEVYGKESEDDVEEVQPQTGAIVSFKVVEQK